MATIHNVDMASINKIFELINNDPGGAVIALAPAFKNNKQYFDRGFNCLAVFDRLKWRCRTKYDVRSHGITPSSTYASMVGPLFNVVVVESFASKCPKLEIVDFSNTDLTDMGLITVVNYCPNINSIDLSNTHVFDLSVAHMVKNLQLQELNLNCVDITSIQTIKTIAQHCPDLACIELCNNVCLGDEWIYELLYGCNKLKQLNLAGCNISHKSMAHIGTSLRLTLTHLYIDDTNVCDLGISLLNKCKNLYACSMSRTNITNHGITQMSKGCSSLVYVDVVHTDVTLPGVLSLARNCPKLETISINGDCLSFEDAHGIELLYPNIICNVNAVYDSDDEYDW